MIKRVIDVSEQAYISLKNNQLLINKQKRLIAAVPVEDLGILILEHPAIVITQAAIISCQKNNTVVVFCDDRHLPCSLVLPINDGHSLHTKILQRQIPVSKPTKKQLWHQVVCHKISQQSDTLERLGIHSHSLKRMIAKVKSGDRENHEAQAAQLYWRLLMGANFRRDQHQQGVNTILNYGYAIVRAMMARALVSGGLHPALGIHHCNQYNSLCLADDLMEPFRPWVDFLVWKIKQKTSNPQICQQSKKDLLGLIGNRVVWKGKTYPMMVAVQYFVANFKSVMFCEEKKLGNSNPSVRRLMLSFGGMHTMWVIVLFDLPTDTQQARKQYARFRKNLLLDGFSMMQYSVYMRHSASEENAQVHVKRVREHLPPNGEVRILKITDKQFGKIQVYYGQKRQPTERPPAQLSLF